MNKSTLIILLIELGILLSGCATKRLDHHIVKLDLTYDHVINNPYEWALQQFSDGPISGPDVGDYARLVLAHGLKETHADLAGDARKELLLREKSSGRVWTVLVFTPVQSAYKYIGNFTASYASAVNPNESSVLVYEACGGKYGYIYTYTHDGKRFNGTLVRDIHAGDGAPEANNKLMAKLFSQEKRLKWTKTGLMVNE
ncbi:MAG: hypothetical protein HRT89_13460 [Lentisphaeria bacterium]|nr:hypothetical protein [Lentisphaeria bacterium]NQZ69065.1 hypothetical protein [Lentisphaeria bacterium]